MGTAALGFISMNRKRGPAIIPLLWNKLEGPDGAMASEYGPTITSVNSAFSAGKFGNAIKRDQSTGGNNITFSNPALMAKGSVEMWIYPDSALTNAEHLFNVGDGVSTPWLGCYFYNYSGGMRFVMWRGGSYYDPLMNGGGLNIGAWNHIAFAWDFNGIGSPTEYSRVYQDGAVCSGETVQQVQSIYDPITEQFKLAEAWDDTRYFDGKVDNIKIWDYAKTDYSDRNTEGI